MLHLAVLGIRKKTSPVLGDYCEIKLYVAHNYLSLTTNRKTRAQREKEEKLKEEEQVQAVQKDVDNMAEQPPFTLPGDPQLLKYIEEVQERVAPLPSTKDQVVALAQYVG
jgi:hypothetical protein